MRASSRAGAIACALVIVGCNASSSSPADGGATSPSTTNPPQIGPCPSPETDEIVAKGDTVWDVAADDKGVYWIDGERIYGMDLPSGSPVQLAQAGTPGTRIAIDHESVYYTFQGGASFGDIPTLDMVPRLGGLVQRRVLTAGEGSGRFAVALALDAKTIYFSSLDGTIGSVPKAPNGGIQQLVSGLGGGFAAQQITIVGNTLYFPANRLGVMRAPITGGTPTTIAGTDDALVSTADASNVYWGTGQRVFEQVPVSGGTPIVLGEGRLPNAMAVDASWVYWNDGDHVARTPIGGGDVSAIACGSSLQRVVVTDAYVYWTTLDAVHRAKKTWPSPPSTKVCASTGASCATEECCDGTCDLYQSACIACRPLGTVCKSPSDCCSQQCFVSPPSTVAICECQPSGNPCSVDANCCDGIKCIGGYCGGLHCSPPEKSCGGTCVDISKDPKNCGDCGVPCGSGTNCCGGACNACLCAAMSFNAGSGATADCTQCCSKSCDAVKPTGASYWIGTCNP